MNRALTGTAAVAAGLALLLWACTAGGSRNAHFLPQAEKAVLRGEYARAAGYYEAYLSDNPGDPRRAELFAAAGRCHLGAGKAKAAEGAFDRALAADPAPSVRAEALFRRGLARRAQGDPAGALRDLRAAGSARDRRSAVTDDELYYETAVTLCRAGDWAAGQREFAKVGDHGPFAVQKAVRLGLSAFAVQVGAFEEEGHARSHEAKVRLHAKSASVRPVPGEQPLYVVTAGPFARYDDARREAKRLQQLGFADAFVIP